MIVKTHVIFVNFSFFTILYSIFRMTSVVFRRFLSTARNIFVFNESKWNPEILEAARQSCSVCENFITEEEEKRLLTEVEPHMKRLKYEQAHWDNAIYLYR